MSFNRLTDILSKLQKNYPLLARRLEESRALAQWETAVGPTIAKHARAVRIEDGVLKVQVDHPIWKSELHHRKRQIIEQLHTLCGKPLIQDIFFL